MIKNILGGLVAGLVGAALIVGGVELARKPLDIPTAIKGEQGIAGERGSRGLTGEMGIQGVAGMAGKDGKDGKDGLNGVAGKDAVTDVKKLAVAVKEELDRVVLKVTLNGGVGDSSRNLVITQGANYDFNVTHFGSGVFAVGIKKSDGNLINLVSNSGQLNTEFVRYLAEGSYTLYISATNDWIIKVEEK